MANTNKLKIVEQEMIDTFYKINKVMSVKLSTKQKKSIFLGMVPDLVAYAKRKKMLYIGEITTSGYFGQRGKDFHLGAVRKIFEAFSKFYLIKRKIDISNLRSKLKAIGTNIQEFNEIKCHFIVPEGARFLNAFGFRKELFNAKIMDLNIIRLSPELQKIMEDTLRKSINEMKNKND